MYPRDIFKTRRIERKGVYFCKSILILVFSLVGLLGFAQNGRLKKGIKKYEFQQYQEAIRIFEAELKADESRYTPLKYLANSYRKIKDYENAELFFLAVINSDSAQAEDFLYYGQSLKSNGKLAAAKEQFIKFAERSNNSFLGNLMLQSIEEIASWENEAKSFYSRSSSGFNTKASEYGILFFDGKYYITTNREINHNSPESFGWDETPFLSIYEIDTAQFKKEGETFSRVKGQLNTLYHDGPMTIDKESGTVIITRVDNQMRGKDFKNQMKLYQGIYEEGKWKDFEPLPFNSDDYSVGHAFLADSGNTLYFASDMPGGFGGMDLYASELINKQWSEPKNLGPSVNTRRNEVFPAVFNQMLYFASDGFPGYGGLDLFYSEFNNGWQSPVNMRGPINSTRDDFGIYFITDSTGFYASNRPGGEGQDDIYRFRKSSISQPIAVQGVFEYKGNPVDNQKIILLNENDSTLAVSYTDSLGHFQFKNLSYHEDFIFQIETTEDTLLDDSRLFLADENWEKIKLLRRWNNDKFKFKALPVEELEAQQLLAMDSDKTSDQMRFAGKIFKRLPGDYDDEVMVYLVNEDGEVVDSVLSGPFGEFQFKKLALDGGSEYFVKLEIDDPDMNLALINETGRIYEVTKSSEDGSYKLLTDIDPTIMARLATDKGQTAVVARLEYQGKPLPYSRVEIYDNNNKQVATVYTNEKGEFQYNKLKFDGTYYFTLPEVAKDTLNETLLYVIDTKGDPLYLINRLRDGRFTFNALPYSEYNDLKLLEELRVPAMVQLKGQVYKKLPGDHSDGLKVYLIDESGAILDSVYTDQNGKFDFQKLDPDRSYSFKVANANELNLALLNDNDLIIEKAVLNENGNFAYKKLTYQVAQFEPLDVMDADLVSDGLTKEIFGQVFKKLPGDFDHGMEVYIYDSEGNLVDTAYTDERGRFAFKKLKNDENYFFKIENQDEDFQLVTLDEEDNILDKTIKNRLGMFKYKALGMQHHEIYLEEAEDHHQILHIDDHVYDLDTFTVHYRFDSTLLNTEAKRHLKELIRIVKDTELRIEIESHTDTRGPIEYNERLSKQRTNNVINFLISHGIRKDRIVGNYYGELKPKVDCETKDCDNDDHYLNRRTEIHLSKGSSW